MSTATAPVKARKTYANDGSYDSVKALLVKLANQCHQRAEKLGLAMEFDDVLQMMNLNYVKARRTWNPEGGARFSTYCQTTCMNNFNSAIEREVKTIREFGMTSIDAFGQSSEEGLDELGDFAGDPTPSTEERMVQSDDVRERLARLTPPALRLIQALLQHERAAGCEDPPRLRELAREVGLAGEELRRVKVEILSTFGVRWV
jgi:RNA polymerase sigma factor (sigma-70 family)